MKWELGFSDLPGVRAACRQVVDDLAAGKSVVWLIPDHGLIPELTESVLGVCDQLCLRSGTVSLSGMTAGAMPPGAFLCASLGLATPDGAITPHRIWQDTACPDVVLLRDFDLLPEGRHGQWSGFVVAWSRAAHAYGQASEPRALFVPTRPACGQGMSPDVRLSLRPFWAQVSQLEMRMLARSQASGPGHIHVWSETVAAELAGGDAALLAELIAAADADVPALFQILDDYGRRRGWIKSKLLELGAARVLDLTFASRMRFGEYPPRDYEGLWRLGALVYTDDAGMDLHSAALAILDRRGELEQRVWRTQVRVLLPLLDAARRDICHHLTRSYGPGWVHLADPVLPGDVYGDPNRPLSEFGHLEGVTRSPRLGFRVRTDLADPVRLLREVRNSLAHYTPVSRGDFMQVLATLGAVERMR